MGVQNRIRKTCRPWKSVASTKYDPTDFQDSLAENYCRNHLGEKSKPWCYHDEHGNWEYCNVPLCGKKKRKSESAVMALHLSLYISLLDQRVQVVPTNVNKIRRK